MILVDLYLISDLDLILDPDIIFDLVNLEQVNL